MADSGNNGTPLLDELQKGPWPSFVTEIKSMAGENKMCKDLLEEIWEFWGEHGKARERIGELIQRVGLGNFLEAIGLEPLPEMIAHPRENPYVFYEEYYEEGEEDEEEE